MRTVHVKHVSYNGAPKERLVYGVVDAWYDDLFSFKGNKITPAVRLVYGEGREYSVIGLSDPQFVVSKIRTEKNMVLLGLDDFDPPSVTNAQAFYLIAEAFPDISRTWWEKSFARAKYVDQFWAKVKYHPRTSTVYEDLELCAYCLPTPPLPPGVSKLQYFTFLKKIS